MLALFLSNAWGLFNAWLRSHGCQSGGMRGEGGEEEVSVNNGERGGVNKGEEGCADRCRVSQGEVGK